MIRLSSLAGRLCLGAMAASLGGCAAVPRATALPDSNSLPLEDCACKEDGDCGVYEMVAGRVEVRNASCRWIIKGFKAECSYKHRFWAEGLNGTEEPDAWSASRVLLRPSTAGDWCALPPENA